MAPIATVASNPSIKRKPLPKGDYPTKKPKVSLELVVGLMAKGKTVTPINHGAGKRPHEGSVHYPRETARPSP